MRKVSKIALLLWSALICINGIAVWVTTMGSVQSTEFNILITILNNIGMFLVWIALYTVWRTQD